MRHDSFASVCCAIGISGTAWLWWKFGKTELGLWIITLVMTVIYCGSMIAAIVVYQRLLDDIVTPHDREVAAGVSLSP